jgi:hypothetical protein
VAWTLTRDIPQVREQFRQAAFNLVAVNPTTTPKTTAMVLLARAMKPTVMDTRSD